MVTKIQLKDSSLQPTSDFTGYQLILLFHQSDSSAGQNALPTSKILNVSPAGIANFDQNNLQVIGNIQISLRGPAGNILSTKEIDQALLIGRTSLELDYAFSQLILSQPEVLPAGVVNGKLIDITGSKKLEEIQIIIYGALTAGQFLPVQVINTESEGYFFFSYPADNYLGAYALIGVESSSGKNKIPITFDKDQNGKNVFPKRLLLVLEPDDTASIPDTTVNCGCNEFNFQEQKRILDEFSYYSLIRTSDPEIKAYVVNDEEEITLDQLITVSPTSSNPIVTAIIADPVSVFGHPSFRQVIKPPVVHAAAGMAEEAPPPAIPVVPVTANNIADQLKNISIKKSVVRDFFDRYKVLNKDTYLNLLQMNDASKIGHIIKDDIQPPLGRTGLTSNHQVDWDNNPTIYQATSIAYGHLLHYKQQWVADGYSLGDLVYSLPLAPGQKKEIVVFDWERRESASNLQEIDYQESLDNLLSRDRDINEIASGVVNEKLNGSSTSTVKSASAGLGAAIGPLVLGASGGVSKSSSSASQESMRGMAASDSQYLSDKTVQSANGVRSQRSTVIQTVAQGEKYEVSSESVANYNHCHALTIQYFEVLRHFKVQQRLVDAQECLFVPLPISTFDIDKARRWKEILIATLRDKSLHKAFDALQRVKDHWEHSDFPATTFAAENVLNLSGSLKIKIDLMCPSDKLVTKTRQVTYPAAAGEGATYTQNEDYTVAEYDDAQWQWVKELLGMNTSDFYITYIKDQKNRDDIFRKQLGDKIAQKIVANLSFKVVDENNNNLPVTIDASLSSSFHNDVPLAVSLHSGITSIPREKFIYLRMSLTPGLLLSEFTKILVVSGSANYRTQHISGKLFNYAAINDDLGAGDDVMIYCAPTHNELRNPKEDDVAVVNKLIYHLNANLEFYHKMIWLYITPERRFMLLDGINISVESEQRIRSVASVVSNKLIGIVGNSMVFQVIPGLNLNPDFKQGIANEKTGQLVPLIDYYQHEPLDPLRISVPTKGVFAEAIMGKCNSCEIKDEQRFWRWEESPIPDSPTAISPIVTPTPAVTQPNLQANPLTNPVVNIQNAPNAPDPQGLANALNLLGKGDTFKDVTGLTQNQQNALAGLQASLNTTSSFGQMGLDLKKANLEHDIDQQKLKNDMSQAKLNAMTDLYKQGKINKEDFDKAINSAGEDPELTKTKDANAAVKKGDITPEDANKLKPKSAEEKLDLAKKQMDVVDEAVKSGKITAKEGEKRNAEILKKATDTTDSTSQDNTQTPDSAVEQSDYIYLEDTVEYAKDFEDKNGYQKKVQYKITTSGTYFKVELINQSFDYLTLYDYKAKDPKKALVVNNSLNPLLINPGSSIMVYDGILLNDGTKQDCIPVAKITFGYPLSDNFSTNIHYKLPFKAGNKFFCLISYLEAYDPNGDRPDNVRFRMDKKTEITAAADGIVVCTYNAAEDGAARKYGNFVKVMNTDMTYSVYGGLEKDSVAVKPGDTFLSGDLIGYAGNSDDMGEPGMSFHVRITRVHYDDVIKFRFWNDSDQSFITESTKCYERGAGEVPCS